MADPSYPAFPILAFIALVLVLVPLPWHLQAWNSGTCLFMIWTALALLNVFVNSIVWHNNVTDWAPVWCDISTRINIAASVAIPAASLCISRRLYKISACQTVTVTREDKRRDIIVDLLIGVGLPLLELPLHYIVNGHRYDILEDAGCTVATYNTVPAYPLVFVWPLVICFVSSIFCLFTIRSFLRRRLQFNQFLSSNSSLTANRYFRLMALASIELLVNIPVSTYGLYININRTEIHPWVSWANTHYGWYIIDKYPALLWRMNPYTVVAVELSRWSTVFVAFVFFAFFGFSDEARKHYKAMGIRLGIVEKQTLKTLTLPLYKSPVSAARPKSSTASSTIGSPTSFKGDDKISRSDLTIRTNVTYDVSVEDDSLYRDKTRKTFVYPPSASPTTSIFAPSTSSPTTPTFARPS
ncbi:pheromone A receptor-domain-containing protein [Armillaria novae-zelandiae]|uniref:Pheromone A receptor-domain-containing protein n=1 Tax=Armillaria novae-zelandiae TaxID=153914 RepID=A0AA39KJ22_9AGAR|nr:pheromone A receptor-domain-containing protein [Armillaria novae-zelandiae]